MDFGKTIKLKWGEIHARFRDDLTAMVRKDKMQILLICTVHQEYRVLFVAYGNLRTRQSTQNTGKGYVDRYECMTNTSGAE